MEKSSAYTHLARWFEYLNDDCGYEKWSQYFVAMLENYSVPKKTGLDMGCGGGYFSRALYKNGYRMTGMDISAEMLSSAQLKAQKEGLQIPYLLGDISSFQTQEKYGFIVAANDCVNYLPKEKLPRALKRVHTALEKGGLFLFDVSSERKFREKIANTVNVDDRDEITYLSFGSVDGEKAVLDVSLFVKDNSGKYDRFDERHEQYIYTEDEIVSALENAGFTLLRAEGHLGEDKRTADRICFVAKKG